MAAAQQTTIGNRNLGFQQAGSAQVDAFLELDGVKGESNDDKYKGKIEILSWSWGMANTGSAQFGGGAGAGKVQVNDLAIFKRVDKSTPILMKNCATGVHIDKGKMIVRKAGGEKSLEYFTIELKDVLISAVETHSDSNSPWLMEEVHLNFSEFKVVYTPQDQKGGAGGAVEFGYNMAKNKAA